MARFDYCEANTVGEAVSLLADRPGASRFLAGGTDLLPHIRRTGVAPERLIGLTTIPGLSSMVSEADGSVSVGALTTLHSIVSNPLFRGPREALAEAAFVIGSRQIRNVATIGGNICNASPAADTAPPLLALGAVAQVTGTKGDRTVDLAQFFAGPSRTSLSADEMLVSLLMPAQPVGAGSAYIKLSPRRAMDIAVVGVASFVALDPALGTCSDVRIALGAVAATPIRAREAESILMGRELDDDLVLRSAKMAASEANPISDIRASREYRSAMIEVLVRRTLRLAAERARRAVPAGEVTS